MTLQQTETPKEIVELSRRAEALNKYLSILVTDGDSQKQAGAALAEVRALIKDNDKTLKFLIEPNKTAIERLKGESNKIQIPLKQIESHISGQLSSYAFALEQARIKEQQHLDRIEANRDAKAQERGEARVIPEIVAPLAPTPAKTVVADDGSKVTMVKRWRFVVTNPALISREYLVIDQVALNRVAVALKEKTNIAGGHAEWEMVPSTRQSIA